MALGTGDADAALSFWNPDLLTAVRTGVDMVCFPILHMTFAAEKRGSHFVLDLQEFYILLITFLDIA